MPTTTDTTSQTLTDLLSHLIRMPTVTSDHATNRAATDWVQEQLYGLPLKFKRFEHNDVSSLIATTPAVSNPKKPKLWLYAHIDVVPGTPDEFKPVERDGKLFGRGVFDMKYAIALYIKLLCDLGEDLKSYDLGLIIVSDEEGAGENGAGYLASLGYAGKAMLLPECGTSWSLETGAKAVHRWRVTAAGHSGHAARPWLGTNAIDRLTAFLDRIRSQFPTEPCGNQDHLHNTINIGTIQGGAAANQIPGSAEATFDIRLIPDTSALDSEAIVRAAADAPGLHVEQLLSGTAFSLPTNGPAKLFESLVLEITGRSLAELSLTPPPTPVFLQPTVSR
jgi:succinyl-diaminopimelate desuccinylase